MVILSTKLSSMFPPGEFELLSSEHLIDKPVCLGIGGTIVGKIIEADLRKDLIRFEVTDDYYKHLPTAMRASIEIINEKE